MIKQTEETVSKIKRNQKKFRKATLGDFIKVESILPKKMANTESRSKTVKVKNNNSNSKMDKDNARIKKVCQKAVKKDRKCQNTENYQFLCFNKFSVLENEELGQESIKQISSETLKIPEKVLKKMTKPEKSFRNYNSGSVVMASSEGKFPKVARCIKCFLTHFPSAKSCKIYAEKPLDDKTKILLKRYFSNLKEDISANKIIRLRGGAGNVNDQSPLIVQRAITSAEKHGIALVQGILNKADGNCAFDAVLNNINHRNCFVNKLSLPSTVYRQVWVTELEMESSNYPALGAGYTKEEKEENWNQLKQSGVYEVDFFGDMVIHAIARGCNKNILIFNTNIEAADPIYVIQANHFGGFSNTDIPVVIAYNQVHYESLHPLTDQDTEQTKMLMHSYINGTYQYKKKDIPFLFLLLLGKTQKQPL